MPPWAGVGVNLVGSGTGVGVAEPLAGCAGWTGCWGVGNGDCQADGEPGVGVGEPGGVFTGGRAGKSSFWDGLRGPGSAGKSSFCCCGLAVVLEVKLPPEKRISMSGPGDLGRWVVVVVVVVVVDPRPKPGRPVPGTGPPP